MILTNAIKKHLEKILTQPPEDREISFYMDLLVSLASNPHSMTGDENIGYLGDEDVPKYILRTADNLIELLLKTGGAK